ncbi:MAG: DUF624 domain-containing protein [Chloroflexota bacterium]
MVSSDAHEQLMHPPGPLRLAFTRAARGWYYGLIPFSVMNFLWLVSVLTIIGGPPATAAMLAVARDALLMQGGEPRNFLRYMGQYFWRAWGLGLVSLLGTAILVTDIAFYANVMSGNHILMNMGTLLLLYVLIIWVEFLLLAWPLLVDRPEMPLRDVVRNAAILTLRVPAANFGLALIVAILCVLSVFVAVLFALAFTAFVSLMVQHYLYLQAPVLANFLPLPGEDAEQATAEENKVQF